MKTSINLFAAVCLLCGCGAAAAPPTIAAAPASPSASPPSASASEAHAPSASASSAASAAKPPSSPRPQPPPPVVAAPLPPLTRALVNLKFVRTPAGIRVLPEGETCSNCIQLVVTSVHGQNPRDVWLLATEEETKDLLLHYDGQRITQTIKGPFGCFGALKEDVSRRFVQVLTDQGHVRVHGYSRDPNSRVGGDVTASLDLRTKRWTCSETGVGTDDSSSGDYTWKLQDPAMGDSSCQLRPIGGTCIPIPWWSPSYVEPSQDSTEYGVRTQALWMQGLNDGWLANGDESGHSWLFRFNGVGWSPIVGLDRGRRIAGVWADQNSRAWAVVAPSYGTEGKGGLLRIEGREVRPLPVPDTFKATYVRGTGPRDVWFVGGKEAVYQWDGETLRQGKAPFEVADVWSSPGGEVWMVGDGLAAHTAPLEEVAR